MGRGLLLLAAALALLAACSEPAAEVAAPAALVAPAAATTTTATTTTTTTSTTTTTTSTTVAPAPTTTFAPTTTLPFVARSTTTSTTAASPPRPVVPVVLAAGDIASCSSDGDERTAALLDALAGEVVTLGDNAYERGAPTEFARCYHPTWGRHRERTHPSPGNHDYGTAGAAGYFDYFRVPAWYSWDLGGWHLVSLNSNCSAVGGCHVGSPQETWLRADLERHAAARCTIAYWHHPRFSSGEHGGSDATAALWQALYDHGADVVLAGHDHTYERLAPADPAGGRDDERGIRSFVVGTGGRSAYAFQAPLAITEARANTSLGVLELTLGDGTYRWRFVPATGAFTDSGEGICHSPI